MPREPYSLLDASPDDLTFDPGPQGVDAILHVMGLLPEDLDAASGHGSAADPGLSPSPSLATLIPRGIARLRTAMTSRRLQRP